MDKVRVITSSGTINDRPVLCAFTNNSGKYVVFDNEIVGSKGSPIILVCKIINDNKLVKIADDAEWGSAKESLLNIGNGKPVDFCSFKPGSIEADDVYYRQLTVNFEYFEKFKTSYEAWLQENPDAPSNGGAAVTPAPAVNDANDPFKAFDLQNAQLQQQAAAETPVTPAQPMPAVPSAPETSPMPEPVVNNPMPQDTVSPFTPVASPAPEPAIGPTPLDMFNQQAAPAPQPEVPMPNIPDMPFGMPQNMTPEVPSMNQPSQMSPAMAMPEMPNLNQTQAFAPVQPMPAAPEMPQMGPMNNPGLTQTMQMPAMPNINQTQTFTPVQPMPVVPEMPQMGPMNNPVMQQPAATAPQVDYTELKQEFMSACEKMFDALVIKLKN